MSPLGCRIVNIMSTYEAKTNKRFWSASRQKNIQGMFVTIPGVISYSGFLIKSRLFWGVGIGESIVEVVRS